MTQTGKGGKERNYIRIDRIDFFGKFYRPLKCTNRQNNQRINFIAIT